VGRIKMTKYGMVIDTTKCNGCYNCFLVCKDEYCGNDYPPYSLSQPMTGHFWMRMIEKERGQYPKVKVAYTAIPCMHCENAPCVKASQNGAVYRRPDGIFMVDPAKAVGQKEILNYCPYRVIYWNEEKNIPQKCTLCAHLLDAGWKEPRCVEACPTGALVFGDMDDPNSEVSKLIASGKTEVLHPEYGLQEKVRYIGLPKRFVAGSVVFGDTDMCAENVSVTLIGDRLKKTIKTNNYGDFEFEGVEVEKEYLVKIEHSGYNSKDFKIKTRKDIYLSEIILDAHKI
jgi:Fe-S-cluster-containing dehydrogenase component